LKMSQFKVTYFNIEGAGEPVRLAFVLNNLEFEDNRIDWKEWEEMKPSTKFGQLPELTLNGKESIAQSGAILRFVGRLGDGSLYPQDPMSIVKVEEAMGLIDDFARAFSPSLYISMRPQMFGYDAEFSKTEEGKATVKKVREKFVEESLPRLLNYFAKMITDNNNKFLCSSEKPTIADCLLLPNLRKFQKGFIDYIPTSCLDSNSVVVEYIQRMMNIPEIKKWYEVKQ